MTDAPVVDVHCHTFNAADLPVRGFIEHVEAKGSELGKILGRLAALLVGNTAPGYDVEKARLDALLSADQVLLDAAAAGPAVSLTDQLQAEAADTLLQLQGQDSTFLRQLATEVAAADRAEAGVQDAPMGLGAQDNIGDIVALARRAIAWVKIFGRYRLEVAGLLVESSGDAVDLYCPMLVDLGTGLGEGPRTTVRQQVELQEKISRLSMLGRLPTPTRGRFHPFVGFDPRRELAARRAGDIDLPLDVVRSAVERYGCIGVKLYPPMGWRPIGNTETVGMSAADATEIDAILRELYTWCETAQVPITAHCNESNYADDAFKDFTGPKNWIAVLTEFPKLHLNLGHFGGAHLVEPPDGWPRLIAAAVEPFDHLYVDVGNQPVYSPEVMVAYLDMLAGMFADPATEALADRIMFGSDWYMVALHPDADRFLTEYRALYEGRFGADAGAAFMGGTALRFLGFDDAENANAMRLRARYDRFAPTRVPPWLAMQTPGPSP
jgi:predicted TIM-barrel fold metal-dependent hydrolase